MARIVFDRSALQAIIRAPAGQVAADLYRRGLRVESRAKQLCSGEMVKVQTGNLRSSIRTELGVDSRGLFCRVGTNVRYAIIVHNGRGPVRPIRASVLRWRSGGKVIFRRYAGPAKPRPFLKDALPAAGGIG